MNTLSELIKGTEKHILSYPHTSRWDIPRSSNPFPLGGEGEGEGEGESESQPGITLTVGPQHSRHSSPPSTQHPAQLTLRSLTVPVHVTVRPSTLIRRPPSSIPARQASNDGLVRDLDAVIARRTSRDFECDHFKGKKAVSSPHSSLVDCYLAASKRSVRQRPFPPPLCLRTMGRPVSLKTHTSPSHTSRLSNSRLPRHML